MRRIGLLILLFPAILLSQGRYGGGSGISGFDLNGTEVIIGSPITSWTFNVPVVFTEDVTFASTTGDLVIFHDAAGDTIAFGPGLESFSATNTQAAGIIALQYKDGDDTFIAVDTTGNLGVGTKSPDNTFEMVGDGIFTIQDNETDATDKNFWMALGNRSIAEEDVLMMYGTSTSIQHILRIGGGHSSFRAATEIRFLTQAYNNTGIQRMVLDVDGNLGMGTTSPFEKFHIDEAGGTDNTGHWIANASVSTTDATLTTIYTLATTTDRAYRILLDYSGSQDDGSNSMGALHSFTIKNVAGTVTEQGDVSVQETDDSAGIVLSGAVSGTNYLIQVTAIAAENWNHEGTIRATVVAH